jgi:hypothetical protein
MIQKYRYDNFKYPFADLLSDVIGFKRLPILHEQGGFEDVGNVPGKDNNSKWHNLFYDNMRGSKFIECYDKFMANVIRPKYNESIIAQRYPSLRISIPGGKGVAAYHVDSDYNHQIEEINVWLPLTFATHTSTIYIESEPGKKDYTPQNLIYSEYLMFPGGVLSHGNQENQEGFTRVSIDMRVMPLSQWKGGGGKKGMSHGKVMDLETYYKIIE